MLASHDQAQIDDPAARPDGVDHSPRDSESVATAQCVENAVRYDLRLGCYQVDYPGHEGPVTARKPRRLVLCHRILVDVVIPGPDVAQEHGMIRGDAHIDDSNPDTTAGGLRVN